MSLKDKLKKITEESPSRWVEEAKVKVVAKGVRKKARKIALEVLRILRERGMTQTDLAEVMGVSRQQVAKIVKGQENLTLETIDKLEVALGVELLTIGKQEEVEHDEFTTAIESHWMEVQPIYADLPKTALTVHAESKYIVGIVHGIQTPRIKVTDYTVRSREQISYKSAAFLPKARPDVAAWDVYKSEETEMYNFS